MELDVAAPAGARRTWSIGTQVVGKALRGRVVDRGVRGICQADIELVVNSRFARVFGLNGKIDVTELVRPGRATDDPGARGLARLGVRAGSPVNEEVPRNAGPVNVQACAMVDVLQVTPSWRTVLASSSNAEVRLCTVVYNPAATGEKVARWCRPGFDARRGHGPDREKRASHDQCQYQESGCQFTDFSCSFAHLLFLLSHVAHLL